MVPLKIRTTRSSAQNHATTKKRMAGLAAGDMEENFQNPIVAAVRTSKGSTRAMMGMCDLVSWRARLVTAAM